MNALDTLGWARAGWGHMGGGWHMPGWGGGFMMFVWIVVIALVVYVLVRNLGGNRDQSARTESPETGLDILKKRYAAGEISREEFEEKKRDLQ